MRGERFEMVYQEGLRLQVLGKMERPKDKDQVPTEKILMDKNDDGMINARMMTGYAGISVFGDTAYDFLMAVVRGIVLTLMYPAHLKLYCSTYSKRGSIYPR